MLVYIKATLKISGTPTVRGISKALHPSRGGRGPQHSSCSLVPALRGQECQTSMNSWRFTSIGELLHPHIVSTLQIRFFGQLVPDPLLHVNLNDLFSDPGLLAAFVRGGDAVGWWPEWPQCCSNLSSRATPSGRKHGIGTGSGV